MNQILPGVGYGINATNKGFSLNVYNDSQTDESNAVTITKVNQFQCFVDKVLVGETYQYRLKIVKGEVPYTYSTSDLGYILSVVPLFWQIDKFNLFPASTRTNGSDATSDFLNQGGYLTLSTEEDYVVFVYILGPQFEPDGSDPYEFIIPQLGVSKIGDEPEQQINSGTGTNRTFEINTEIVGGETLSVNYLFANTFSVRANIARIKWNAVTENFDIEQITNYPNLYYTPFIAGAASSSPTFDSTTVDGILDGFTGYTKDLNEDVIGYDVVAQGEL
jgi:hypothetical protein